MKRNRIAIVLVLILGITSTVLIMMNKSSTIRPELKDFAITDTAAITKIRLKDKANYEVTLEKVAGGRWMVNQKYYARPDAVKTLLYTMMAIKVRNPVGKRALENVIKQLASGSTKVEAFEGDKLVKAYYVGGGTQDDEGTYMLLVDPETGQNSSAPFVVNMPGFKGYLTSRYFTKEREWRDKTVFSYRWNEMKSIQVDYAVKKESSFTLNVKGENDFEVLDPSGAPVANLDTMKVKSYLGFYYNIQYEGIEDIRQALKDSVVALGWVHSITVTDVSGKKTNIKTYRKPPPSKDMTDPSGRPLVEDTDRMFAFMNDNKDEVLVIQYYVFGKLFMPVTHFEKKGTKQPLPVK